MNKKTLIFAAAVAAQVLILIAMPLKKVYTRATGQSVILKVVPVDPYNILSGYYVTLGYDISRPTSFPNAPQDAAQPNDGEEVFAVVERQDDGAWQPVLLTATQPGALPPNQVFIRGRKTWRQIEYGIEEFYIPEAKRGVIEQDLRENINQARVEVKVDARGNAALVRLMIADRVYE